MTQQQQLLIPAGGTVRLLAFNMGIEYPTRLEIDGVDIEGQVEWRRPVVGLVIRGGYDGPADPLSVGKDGDSLFTLPLVVDAFGAVYEVHEYLHSVVGSCHWECTAHFFEPHISGPVTDAPRIVSRELAR
jgi:hypothetical protein